MAPFSVVMQRKTVHALLSAFSWIYRCKAGADTQSLASF
ncbi:hypothetical protein APY04_2117 [Hyphomicrobium sulfonivorans]|uniref:Uncharacterized protein n=1 Tax=Hyphomicrobium sulfonivorans TaxID=121290 RepID=A0A109BEL8_HYPSL|nr:hypothetical protein APY04_2117 [Hyphomicrobium sulfonivorans]